jgi:hypothetical protein
MQLSNQNITTGDTRRYQVDYTAFLQFGEKLSGFTLAIAAQTPAATSTVNSASSFLDIDADALYLYVVGGVVNENFIVNVQVRTTYGETVNDTIAFTVIAA